ncbi:hypothetical protein PPSIR1_20349 [Plesiocystis pacifica SIR-1]|uniref:Uncharacterized protein n=1 Tax=Plesiocystis pacifica SIR-1 TaxID=391625 RepID=A6G246_9BACT|nr:carboxypeptidase regulatory-like domain-containing protein [Plesiocystis pacifica]EDM80015.1 hypothetical protein PPSIR1_20349 [Plesiocystis pacifica SIR-1]
MMTTPTPPDPNAQGSSPAGKLLLALVGAAALIAALVFMRGTAGEDAEPEDQAQAQTRDGASPKGQKPVSSSAKGPREVRVGASGAVTSRAGTPVEGALVSLAPLAVDDQDGDEGVITTRTDASGHWQLDALAPGRYALSATATDHLPGVRPDVRLKITGDNAGLDLILDVGGSLLSGTVHDVTGGVVEDARVRVIPVEGILALREPDSFFALTDAEGRFGVQVPDGRFRVSASHPDYSRDTTVLDIEGGDRSQDFRLVPMGVVAGVVRRASDDAPVPEAWVTWSRQEQIALPNGDQIAIDKPGGRTRTDEQGRFELRGLSAGMINLSARAPGLASDAPVQLPVAIAERVEDVVVRVVEAQDVAGRVVSAETGEGIAGVRVQARSRAIPGAPGATSGEDGSFVLAGLLPGSYGVEAEAEASGWILDGAPPTVTVTEGAAAESSLRVVLAKAPAIRGRVDPPTRAEVRIELDPDNIRVGSGMVQFAGGVSTMSDAETGVFELSPVLPGSYTLVARAADGRGGTVEVEVPQGGAGLDEVIIPLERRATVAGTIRDAKGATVSRASVRVRREAKGNSSLSVVVNGQELTAISSPTSTEGRYAITGLDAGSWLVEVVDDDGAPIPWADGSTAPLELSLAQAETREPFDLSVQARDGRIAGVVRDAEGNPVPEAWVRASFVPDKAKPEDDEDEPGTSRREVAMVVTSDASGPKARPPVLTDAEGRFELTGLRVGSYRLDAEADGGANTATLDAVRPDADVILTLAPLGRLEGRVLSNGKPADCIARLSGPSQRTVRVRDGRFEVERLQPGAYTVTASTGDGSTSQPVTIEAGDTAEVELVMERFATITGTVIDAEGEPIEKAEILVGSGTGGRIEVSREDDDIPIFTDAEGKFTAKAAAGGRVILVQGPDSPMPIAIKPINVVAGEDQDLGEIRQQDMSGMVMQEGDGPPDEDVDVVEEG